MASKSQYKTVPHTESSNPITENMDTSSPAQMVEMFHKCDLEVFNGPPGTSNSLLGSETLKKKIISLVDEIKAEKNPLCIFSGCGTSGRLGYVSSRNYRYSGLFPSINFEYLMAGGDKALLTSQEAHEDKPLEGIADLKICIDQHSPSRVFMFGITCGMSAPYVAGQLDYSIDTSNITPVLIGFNEIESARKIPIPTWNNKTFHETCQKLVKSEQGYIINPTLGGEHLTGSSRMKGGSATKAILDAIFAGVAGHDPFSFLKTCVRDINDFYAKNSDQIAKMIELGGKSLNTGKSIVYLGKSINGAIGMIDGTECKPTYSASLDDVRGFVENGFIGLDNAEGDISFHGKDFKISFEDLEKSSIDIGMCFHLDEFKTESLPATSFPVFSFPSGKILDHEEFQKYRNQLLLKMALNDVSTGSHVVKGKVMKNYMVDMALTNLKLFVRGREMIKKFAKVDSEKAVECLLKAIYNQDQLSEDILALDDEEHVKNATSAAVEPGKGHCLPIAIILASVNCTVKEAREKLNKEPRVRAALSAVV